MWPRIVARSKEVLATGRDLYLMFKHEESPEGALNAETVLKVGQASAASACQSERSSDSW